jgi:cyclase
MRRIRIIPILLLKGNGLYKTVKFKKPNYIGDPINAVKIFNDKEVDELLILDVTASKENKEPRYDYLKDICSEAFMPLGYGGGVNSFEIASKLFNLGFEKIIINSTLYNNNFKLIGEVAATYGAQSVVVSIDYMKSMFSGNKPYYFSGSKSNSIKMEDLAKKCEESGAGEIILHSIDNDGTFNGLDLDSIKLVSKNVTIPLVACGGLNSLSNAFDAINSGASAIAAGSFFVYKNNNTQSILINYPSQKELVDTIYSKI